MNKDELKSELLDTLMIDDDLKVTDDLRGREEWDSMAALSIMTLFDELFEITLTTEQIKEVKTLQDLIDLANEKLTD